MLKAVRNPLAHLAGRFTPRPRTVRRAATAALVISVVIVVTGGAVRLTGSGLGCETWPRCSDESLVATREMGLHGLIEFTNRMLAYVVTAAVVWFIVAARCAKPRRRPLTRLGWAQFWVVMFNGVLGGITVLTELNPFIVAAHFLAAMALITAATVSWQRAREGDEPARPAVNPPLRRAVLGLTLLTAALVVAGTAVTGSGKHAGDSSDIERMPFDWEAVTRVHSALAWAVVLGTAAVWLLLRRAGAAAAPRARATELFLVLLSQGVVGYAQYFLDEPELLVGIHLLGSTLVWIAALRLLLATRDRGPSRDGEDPAAVPRPAPAARTDREPAGAA
ncbi:COX15/CtaA family protein [Streptomyces sp. DSM 44917]|uniref:COX15/CtaA family protein n=1 Tax=Streptomyces boetiae TaxID=3075541 RepID=A0ABU2L656_9ACTN|nr:COX15/CtaA family protein [Streptomyces sp. DSM 44917]MDT0306728.1 COX15/CtaA family protein [Streptomyces sp. DSM 44917]